MAADAAIAALTEAAPAKVNLSLHLRGRRDDGYHLLESLVVFPESGDRVEVIPSNDLTLRISGPFSSALGEEDSENLVLRAARRLAAAHGIAPKASISLVKNLPVASGIGGGSSDAAATLRALARLWRVDVPAETALSLGADVPVCMRAPAASRMTGIGEKLSPAPRLPDFWMLLVNPRLGLETRRVFSNVHDVDPPRAPPTPDRFGTFEDLREWLMSQRNDLQTPAIALCPRIGDVLSALDPAPLARMSGSGATCFGIFPDRNSAEKTAASIRAREPDWWCVTSSCGSG
ncbi:MAG: 4-(cytidine 5'-diphospho)-2-C-methyl-D-erythritol kinase [Pseudomonadota bacterium]